MKLKNILRGLLAITIILIVLSLFLVDGADFGVWSLLPPLVAILLAFISKQVILSLFLGVFTGAMMLVEGNAVDKVFHGFMGSFDEIVGSVADGWHAGILIFTLMIGGMIGVVARTGGTRAIANALAKKAKTARSAQIATMIMGIAVFFDDYANTLVVGPTMRPLTDKMNVSREKLSYIVDSTAAPVAGMALISTWVGYELGLIGEAFEGIGVTVNSYEVFVKSIPFRFYDIFALVMVFLVAFLMRDFGPMYKAEKRARLEGKVLADNAQPMANTEMGAEEATGNVWNALAPILTLVIVSFAGLWYSGGGPDEAFNLEGIRNAFGNADASVALIWGAALGSIVAIVMAIAGKLLSLQQAFDAWVEGCKSLVITAIILTLAWSLGSITGQVGASDFLVGAVSDTLPAGLIPFFVFLIAMVVAFATGTSWGTMAILITLAIPLAHELGNGDMHLIYATLGSVLTGSIFGDHCSPISDTTIMSSMASASDHIDHVKTQMPYALTTAAVAAAIGYIPAGFGLSPWISLPLGIVAIFLVIRFVGKSVKVEDLKAEQ
jgi:Na+/H+ antiporter NhaC